MAERTKAELIGDVLERMAQDRFEFDDDGDGEVIVIKNYGATFAEMEDFFGDEILELEAIQEDIHSRDPNDPRAQWPLEENWSDWWTEQLLTVLIAAQNAAQVFQSGLRERAIRRFL